MQVTARYRAEISRPLQLRTGDQRVIAGEERGAARPPADPNRPGLPPCRTGCPGRDSR